MNDGQLAVCLFDFDVSRGWLDAERVVVCRINNHGYDACMQKPLSDAGSLGRLIFVAIIVVNVG
jgi:hypothetical protein